MSQPPRPPPTEAGTPPDPPTQKEIRKLELPLSQAPSGAPKVLGLALVIGAATGLVTFFALRGSSGDEAASIAAAAVLDAGSVAGSETAAPEGAGVEGEELPPEAMAQASRELDALMAQAEVPHARDGGSASATAKAPVRGTLVVSLKRGWAEVWIDGRQVGRAPDTTTFQLTPGKHVLELRNPHAARYLARVDIREGKVLVHRAELKAP